ncbi:hypothetical protein EJ73_00854 [Hoylesella shahii DSM 15611 = JCM 12083]|uniref:Uncharacterized protein n=1 Tax=Hoylesella shahii DSM 15611 = JCM 12083 TaxID=1122991 RepID=A0A318HXK9_9BACT|nr:hypothetical protein EJ73_00854 [Hoylesella shahii DSM 15611 = JCM 12083]
MHLHNKHHTPLFGATPFISQHYLLVLNIVVLLLWCKQLYPAATSTITITS